MRQGNLWKLSLPHLFAEANGKGDWIKCNALWCNYTGLSVEESTGKSWLKGVYQDDIATTYREWLRGIEGLLPFELVMRVRHLSDLSYRWHICRVAPQPDAERSALHWIASFTDIHDIVSREEQNHSSLAQMQNEKEVLATSNDYLIEVLGEYRETEIKLEKATAKLNQIIQTQSDLSQAELDMQAFMNLVTERMLTITPATGAVVELMEGDEMVYQATSGSAAPFKSLRLSLSDSLSGLSVINRAVLISEDTSSDQRVNYEACKKVRANSMVVAPLFDDENAVGVLKVLSDQARAFDVDDVKTLEMMAGLIGAAIGRKIRMQERENMLAAKSLALSQLEREIAQREQVEQQLKDSEARFRGILESSHEAFISMDANGKITDWNRQAEETLGWKTQEAIGRRLSDLIIPESLREKHEQGMQKFMDTGHGPVIGRRLELTALNRKGVEIPIEMTISAINTVNEWQFSAFLHDITERKSAEQKLRHLAQYDSLTKLPNRALFYDRLEHAITRSHRSKGHLALMYLDVDRFKSINDNYGHGVGDELLVAFSSRIQSVIRESDTIARLGGDEFVIIAEHLGRPGDAEHIAQKILWAMTKDFQLGNVKIKVGTSIGVAFFPSKPVTADELVKMADEALYAAKQAGRNTYAVHNAVKRLSGN
ncbi:diguanylate cyclase [Hahella sp. KA22]|uniref:diguanylate cyclase domain-containing protein n=1 Tax=Hahella sp. KA22 TaxID=1628392 RepID=UPI000FDEA7D6|nr:diguanylate cyclase [Hahella sp. KA22]AZZ95319.1 diguanylate cyclase [Hahella sp. KA22]QAY52964.1 diguanylate cyclase [Hahella sp. KA22]